MQNSKYHFQSRPLFFIVHTGGNATTVVSDVDAAVCIDDHFDGIAIAG